MYFCFISLLSIFFAREYLSSVGVFCDCRNCLFLTYDEEVSFLVETFKMCLYCQLVSLHILLFTGFMPCFR